MKKLLKVRVFFTMLLLSERADSEGKGVSKLGGQ